jgi:hypothetical protein
MVNDLNVSDDTVKFVDDTTMWEIVLNGQESNSVLPSPITESTKWASENNMKLNPTKTKEVRVGFSLDPGALPPITIDGHDIVVVPHAKLLGVMISKDLKWIEHVDYICKKASKRLYALRLLKRASFPAGKLVRVYTTCVRPILEFSCEVWHYSLAQYLSDEIESIQRRALRIIFPDLKYEDALVRAGVMSLFLQRKTICEKLFDHMCDETSHKLHFLVFPRHKTGYSQYQSIGQVGLLIVLLWPVVRPTTFLPRTIKINNL